MTEQTATSKKKSFRDTLNLPKTAFAMKANLVQNELGSMKRWTQQKLYEQIRRREYPKGRFVFHDGPPYANGSIHLGHLLNKVLKDFVVRSKTMAGYDCPFVPGWDCHGLPIEHMVMQALGERAKAMNAVQIRRRCKSDAEKFIKLQRNQMRRLLTLADYEHPYVTMDPAYEAAVLEVFADLVGKGLVYRDLKPVHWSIENRTALANAELEYYDRADKSIYVLLPVEDTVTLPGSLRAPTDVPVSLMIWTTTPWTLPANLAVSVASQSLYSLYRFQLKDPSAESHEHQTRYAVVAKLLGVSVLERGGARDIERLGDCTGAELVGSGTTYHHPFIDRRGILVAADYVTLDEGTGLVHTAPGHGAEDYHTGKEHDLDIYCPVREDGTFDETAPEWLRGKSIWQGNDIVVEHLRGSDHLFYDHTFTHSYPHDWRGKTPVIFRATEQWFVSVDRAFGIDSAPRASLRDRALDVTNSTVRFFPDWGRNRMRGMLESTPDWCLSRQRAWGLPIPAFFHENGQFLLTAASVRAVADKIRQHGSDFWFTAEPLDLLTNYDATADPDAPSWAKDGLAQLSKATDIFDVWFESGSSWNAVIRQRFGDDWFPTDLYLEGSDQHRGWFQLSLLPSLGVTGSSPFKAVLTHGFMVDKEGHALSKSKGHTIEGLFESYGADVLRWWVSSLNSENDIKVDSEYFKLAGEEYRKVRNTLRFLLGNLGDFDPENHRHVFTEADAWSIDVWALSELEKLVDTVREVYEGFEFRRAHEAMFKFCNHTMSAVYLAAAKDRLYCDRAESARRRRTQTVMHEIADALIRLIAPLLPHTADEAWRALCGAGGRTPAPQSVHLAFFPEVKQASRALTGLTVDDRWSSVMEQRNLALRQIEEFRQSMGIDNPLDIGARLVIPQEPEDAHAYLLKFDPVDLADLLGISRVEIQPAHQSDLEWQFFDLQNEARCERSWKRDGTVKSRGEGNWLSDRDAEVLGL